jgi:uncharacterized protein YkwD
MRLLLLICLSALLQGTSRQPDLAENPVCITEEEKKLYDLLMEYRRGKKLPDIALSSKLTLVAQTHAKDLSMNYQMGSECNPHSWSNKGQWSSCCYTSDHKQAQCMWDKPKEIAGYNGAGYEIAYYSSRGASAAEGLEGWKNSPAHNPVIINQGIWEKAAWKAVGIGFYKEYGVVWFGELEDQTPIKVCAPD